MDFTIVVDATLLELALASQESNGEKQSLLSIINDFEDGKWREDKFLNFVWDNVSQTALTHSERQALLGKPQSTLRRAAMNLRLTDFNEDFGAGSELAEIFLYGLMHYKYNALSVVPKIFYKQNAQDNAKGADSVHIVVNNDQSFTLWFGEAKFYTSIDDARLSTIVTNVKTSLETKKLRKENSLIIGLPELDNLGLPEGIVGEIKHLLDSGTSLDDLKPYLNIPILLIYQCDITAAEKTMTNSYVQKVRAFHCDRAQAYFKKQLEDLEDVFQISSIRFHLILFPVPKKRPLVEKFLAAVNFHKGGSNGSL